MHFETRSVSVSALKTTTETSLVSGFPLMMHHHIEKDQTEFIARKQSKRFVPA